MTDRETAAGSSPGHGTDETAGTLSLAVTGATGRMARTVVDTAGGREDAAVTTAVSRDPTTETVADVPVEPAANLSTVLSDRDVDVVVDFTTPESAAAYAEQAAAAGVAFVTGTTGFEDHRHLERAAERVPVVHARNFAPGAAVLRGLLRDAVAALPAYDVEVIETHHVGKRDAPSGTALTLVDAVADARAAGGVAGDGGADVEGVRRVDGRSGIAPRESGEVGVHAVRAGDVTGEHTVLLAGDDEQLRLQHRVGDRSAFATGAIRAALAVADREPGLYGPEVIR